MSLLDRETIDMSDPRNKRQHILDAAYIIFSKKGFHRATIDEIIALADTGKGTVYNYFVNKEQLFYTLIKERSTPFQGRIKKIVDAEVGALEKIKKITKEFLVFYSENADLWRILVHEMRTLDESVKYSRVGEEQRIKYKKGFDETLELLETILIQGIEQKLVRKCNTKQAAYGLFSATLVIVFQDLVGDDLDYTAEHISNTFLFGIAEK